MILMKLLISFCILLLFFFIYYYVSDKNIWEAYLRSCEKLKPINNYGEPLKTEQEPDFDILEKIDYTRCYIEDWYHPMLEDREFSGTYFLNHKKSNIFYKKRKFKPPLFANENLKFVRKGYFSIKIKHRRKLYFPNSILFFNENIHRVMVSKRNYKLISKNFRERKIFEPKRDTHYKYYKNFNSSVFFSVPYVHPYFMSDGWNQVLPPCRGAYSCVREI